MSKFNSRLSAFISRLCAAALAILGFGCSSGSDPDDPDILLMYGSPTGEFEIKGDVTDETGNAVADAEIRATPEDAMSGIFSLTTAATANDGKYTVNSSYIPLGCIKVVCIPPDDSFEADSVVIPLKYVIEEDRKKEPWYRGHADAVANFKLKKKSDK